MRYFSLILILQIICFYLAYKKRADYWWYIVILLFPLVGCLLFLFLNYFKEEDLESIKSTINDASTPHSSKIARLKKEYDFNNCAANAIALGDAYMANNEFQKAKELFQECAYGALSDDFEILTKLLDAHFELGEHQDVIAIGKKLLKKSQFKNTEERIAFAWSYAYTNQPELSEEQFTAMDVRYSNYLHRKEYCRFLIEQNRMQEAEDKLDLLMSEYNEMEGFERRGLFQVKKATQALYEDLK